MTIPFKAFFSLKPVCPYCKKQLEKMPTRKAKCPFCGKYIYFKRTPDSETKKLVTEEEAKKIEQQWENYYQEKKEDKWIKNLGTNRKAFDNKRTELRKRFGQEPSLRDIIRGLANSILADIFKKKPTDFLRARNIYYDLATLLEEEDKDSFQLRQQAMKMELYNIKIEWDKPTRFKWVLEICPFDDSCDECKKLNGKTFSIDEAIEKMPLPCPTCKKLYGNVSRGRCTCSYGYKSIF